MKENIKVDTFLKTQPLLAPLSQGELASHSDD